MGAPDAAQAQPPLLLLHGWMDVGASFQFVVDALTEPRQVLALDWRGFGLTEGPAVDAYWFPDYLGDLDAVLDALCPEQPIDLLGHSMGGNVAMSYAGVRPQRIRRLINVEGFGLPETAPSEAPSRYAKWLDALKAPSELRPYASLDAVAQRLQKNNPLLPSERALWLAAHWARELPGGGWALQADPAHKRINPVPYNKDETLACWRHISAPLLWVEGDRSDMTVFWGSRYPRSAFEERLAVVRSEVQRQTLGPAGHMVHHDQPQALAACVEAFLR